MLRSTRDFLDSLPPLPPEVPRGVCPDCRRDLCSCSGAGGSGPAVAPQRPAAGQVSTLRPAGAAGDGDVFGVRPEASRACPATAGRVQGGGQVPAVPQ